MILNNGLKIYNKINKQEIVTKKRKKKDKGKLNGFENKRTKENGWENRPHGLWDMPRGKRQEAIMVALDK